MFLHQFGVALGQDGRNEESERALWRAHNAQVVRKVQDAYWENSTSLSHPRDRSEEDGALGIGDAMTLKGLGHIVGLRNPAMGCILFHMALRARPSLSIKAKASVLHDLGILYVTHLVVFSK